MDYEVEIESKLKGVALAAKWHEVLAAISHRLYTASAEQRNIQHDEQIDVWCQEIAKELGFSYQRNGKKLCFTCP